MRITAFLTAVICTLSVFVMPAAADGPEAVSVNKPVYSTVYGEEGYNGTSAANANDDNINTFFYSNKGKGAEDSLVIDLKAKYGIEYVTVTFAGSVSEYYIEASEKDDFSEYITLEPTEGTYLPPEEHKEKKYRYVRLRVPEGVAMFRIREMTVYSNDKPEDEHSSEEAFVNRTVNVSVGKSITSRLYGSNGFNGHVCANANDGDDKTSFISTPTEANPVEWIRIDLGERINISGVTIDIAREVETLEISVSNDVGTEHAQEFNTRILLEKGEDDIYRLPEEYSTEKFRLVEARKASSERVFEVNELTVFMETRDITENSALGKRVKTDGVWSFDSLLTDGNEDGEEDFSCAVIDLEAPSYINNISVNGNDRDNIRLRAGLFDTDPEKMEEITSKMKESKKYRYICVLPENGERISLSEIAVNSFDTDILCGFSRTEEKIAFSLKNICYDRDEKRTAVVCAFDEYGEAVAANEAWIDLSVGEEKTEEVALPGSEYAERCIAFLIKENNGLLGAAYEFSGDEKYVVGQTETPYGKAESKELDEAVESKAYTDGIGLKVLPKSGVTASDKVYVLIYDTEEKIIFADLKPVGEGCSFNYHLPFSAAAGEYTVRLAVNDVFENVYSKKYTFEKKTPDGDLLFEATEAFKNTSASDFADNYDKYYTELGVISFGDIPYVSEHLDRIGSSFVSALAGVNKWKRNFSGNISPSEIHDALAAASIADAVKNGEDNAASLISRYGGVMDNIFDGTENNDAVAPIFKRIEASSGDIFSALKMSAVLSHFEGAATADIVSALEKYADILSVDLDEVNKSGLDIYDIAKRLGNKVESGWGNGLSDEIKKIISALKKNESGSTVKPSSGGGSSGGGSAGGGYSFSAGKVSVEARSATEKAEEDKTKEQGQEQEQQQQKQAASEEAARQVFDDIPADHWAVKSVLNLYQKGIVAGVGNGLFEPERPVKRAEFVKMLVAAFSLSADPNKKISFSDCAVSDWFYPYVDAAVSCMIASGIGGGLFSPESYIQRQDAALMCMNLLNYKGFYDFRGSKEFTDNMDISDYAAEAVGFLSGLGILNGFEDNSFRPRESLNRAQAAVITDALYNLLGTEVRK